MTTAAGDPVSRGLQRLRVLAAAAIVVAAAGMRPEIALSPRGPLAAAALIAAALLGLNLLDRWLMRRDGRARTGLVLGQIAADLGLAVAAPWVLGADLASPATLVAVVPILEAGLRFRVLGAVAAWGAVSTLLAARTMLTADALDPATLGALGQVSLVLLIVALPASYLAEHLAAQLVATARSHAAAERRSGLLGALAVATRELHTLDVPAILHAAGRATLDMGCIAADLHRREPDGGWTVVQRFHAPGADLALPTPDPASAWHPGRLAPAHGPRGLVIGQAGLDGAAQPLLLRTLTPPREARLVDEAVDILVAEAGAALRNAALHARLQRLAAEHERRAHRDELTGLTNRAGVMHHLERLFGLDPRPPLAVLFADLDGFKPVNDRYGHAAGDAVLRTLARRLAAAAGDGGVVARFGGDEFLVLYQGAEAAERAVCTRARVVTALSTPVAVGTTQVQVGASIGVATLDPADTSTPDRLLRQADAMMYAEKDLRTRTGNGARVPSPRPTTRAAPREHRIPQLHPEPSRPDPADDAG